MDRFGWGRVPHPAYEGAVGHFRAWQGPYAVLLFLFDSFIITKEIDSFLFVNDM